MFLIALILGIVEGLTEFLPISSTGHLIIVGELLGFEGETAATFDIFIQLGAILAVVWLYRQRFLELFNFNSESRIEGKNGLSLLLLTSLPAVVLGALLHGFIKAKLFNPLTVAFGLIIGGIALIVTERRFKLQHLTHVEDISKAQALKVGAFQALALWPGVSRAGATIVGGLLSGLDRKAAVEYSFLAAVPVMFAAVGYDLFTSLPNLQSTDIPVFFVGFISAFVAAVFAIKFFLKLLRHHTLEIFGWYRIAVAFLVFMLALAN